MSTVSLTPLTHKELSTKTSESLRQSGIQMTDEVIELVLRTASRIKSESLLRGIPVDEEFIGTIYPSWRRVNEKFSPKYLATPLLKVNMESDCSGDMKLRMTDNLIHNEEFRKNVNAQEL